MTRIAEWHLWKQVAAGDRTQVCLAVHKPEPDPKAIHGDYRTKIEIDGLEKTRYIHGVNSLQSLILALGILRIEIECALAQGCVFYFSRDDEDPTDLLALLNGGQ